jgi:hypothetical protein
MVQGEKKLHWSLCLSSRYSCECSLLPRLGLKFWLFFFRLLVSNIVAALRPTQAKLYVDENFYLSFFLLAKQNVWWGELRMMLEAWPELDGLSMEVTRSMMWRIRNPLCLSNRYLNGLIIEQLNLLIINVHAVWLHENILELHYSLKLSREIAFKFIEFNKNINKGRKDFGAFTDIWLILIVWMRQCRVVL